MLGHLRQKRSASPPSDMESSSKKRARCDEEAVEVLSALQVTPGPSEQEITRDDKYYFADGNCILQVEDTLFNVHRTLLSRDSSSFSTMFELPAPQGGQIDGTSDECPIILSGDSAGAFRNFLWALYALPHEILVVHTPRADLCKLMDIALISNKYSFRSIETWSLDAINDLIGHRPISIFPFNPVTPVTKRLIDEHAQLVARLVRLSQMCAHEKLLSTMITTLKEFMNTSIQYAYLAMTLADELDLRSLRGVAYLEVMQRVMVVARPQKGVVAVQDGEDVDGPAGSEIVDEEGRLIVSPEQQLRLLSGYYRLTRVWEHLRTHPLKFDHAPTCGATWHQHGCTQSWADFWKEKTKSEAVLACGLADVLGRLKATVKEFDRWGTATYMHHDCKSTARRTILEKLKQVEEKLPDYFVGAL